MEQGLFCPNRAASNQDPPLTGTADGCNQQLRHSTIAAFKPSPCPQRVPQSASWTPHCCCCRCQQQLLHIAHQQHHQNSVATVPANPAAVLPTIPHPFPPGQAVSHVSAYICNPGSCPHNVWPHICCQTQQPHTICKCAMREGHYHPVCPLPTDTPVKALASPLQPPAAAAVALASKGVEGADAVAASGAVTVAVVLPTGPCTPTRHGAQRGKAQSNDSRQQHHTATCQHASHVSSRRA